MIRNNLRSGLHYSLVSFYFYARVIWSPTTRIHDMVNQLSRQDIKIDGDIMIVLIKWSKTIQFGNRKLQIPVIADKQSIICPVRWLRVMISKIPSQGHCNLFSYNRNGVAYPITYRDLTIQMRKWLEMVGVTNTKLFSSHSLRRGGCTHAFENNVPENTIKILGDWCSEQL